MAPFGALRLRSIVRHRIEASARRQRFERFRNEYGALLHHPLSVTASKRALIVGSGLPGGETELALCKALELAGFSTVVALDGPSSAAKEIAAFYQLTGVTEFRYWRDHLIPSDPVAAELALDSLSSLDRLLTIETHGVRVGRIAAASARRAVRSATMDFESTRTRRLLVDAYARSLAAVTGAERLLESVKPDILIVLELPYTPFGEALDAAVMKGIDVVTWMPAHASNSILLKRYTKENRGMPRAAASPESWRRSTALELTAERRARLRAEFERGYIERTWFRDVGTVSHTSLVDGEALRQQLGLDPARRTAVIFPHISWDASFFHGRDLFPTYEAWLAQTVAAAAVNDRVNWVIKIHPAHVGKALSEGSTDEPAEEQVLRAHFRTLPPHITLVPAQSRISPYSLFPLMDYCLTVRGTVGIEAARLGVPVLTGGTGAYDGKGFTSDSASPREYLEKIATIERMPRLSAEAQDLAERFAYLLFIQRPLRLTSVTVQFGAPDELPRTRLGIAAPEDWYRAEDLRRLGEWLQDRSQEDFIAPGT
jgi:hypothetical protein